MKVADLKTEERQVEKVIEHTSTVTLRPDWRVACSLAQPEAALLLAGPLVVGPRWTVDS